MKEYPILFSAPMVLAILEGHKTMTRRVIKPQPAIIEHRMVDRGNKLIKQYEWSKRGTKIKQWGNTDYWDLDDKPSIHMSTNCPYGQVGDRLWVRETWDSDCTCGNPKCNGVIYKAGYDGKIIPDKWRPSIFMPRWASRITLEITNISAERLQEIGSKRHDEVAKEGYPFGYNISGLNENPTTTFARYWDSINVKRGYSFASNPYVWVIEFKVL